MTATSELGYYVRGLAAELQGNRAVDTAATRFGLVNNLNHLQDVSTQTYGNVASALSTYHAITSPSTTAYTRFQTLPPIPVFLRPRTDGTSTRIVVTLMGYSQTVGKVSTFRVALMPLDRIGARTTTPGTAALYPNNIAELTTTLGAATELTCTLYANLGDGYRWQWPSTDNAGRSALVDLYMAQIEVWGLTNDGTSSPRIERITAREYVG